MTTEAAYSAQCVEAILFNQLQEDANSVEMTAEELAHDVRETGNTGNQAVLKTVLEEHIAALQAIVDTLK